MLGSLEKCVTVWVTLAATCSVWAGPEWVEIVDAGSLPGTAQKVTGTTEILQIKGNLTPGSLLTGDPGADDQDMYFIQIDAPTIFYASTSPTLNGNAEFDTQLWIFQIDGHGLLGNDNTWQGEQRGSSGGSQYSTIWNSSNDGTKIVITEPGEYLLAISTNQTKPVSPSGDIFDLQFFAEVSGPDGPGGGEPISGWALVPPPPPPPGASGATGGKGEELEYIISLAGVVGIPLVQATLDIEPATCPNLYNRRQNGHTKVAILGSETFDVADIDLSTIRLSRVDGVGGEVNINHPPQPKYKDVSQPYTGDLPCGCASLAGDGFIDLEVKFKGHEMTQTLQLDDVLVGADLPLKVTGTLLDGTPFEAFDCIRIWR